jgi:hypothetical protein
MTSKTNMCVAKRNCLDELDAVVVSDHLSKILFKSQFLNSFPNARLTALVKISRVLHLVQCSHMKSVQ